MANAVAADPHTVLNDTLGAAIAGEQYRWPRSASGYHEIPYVMSPNLSAAIQVLAKDAMDHWASHTTIRLRPALAAELDKVVFVPAAFCASAVGRRGGPQEIWLAPDSTVGNVIHEIGHAVGLWHEHTRSDRDLYVEVNWLNIQPEARHNFELRGDDCLDLGDYDYASIMHYATDAFALDPTLATLRTPPDGAGIGQRVGLSAIDIQTVATLYGNLT